MQSSITPSSATSQRAACSARWSAAVRWSDRLTALGVDEIACLIDFGVPTEQVLESLPRLKQLMQCRQQRRAPMNPDLRRRGHRDPSRLASAVHAVDGVDARRRCGRTLGARRVWMPSWSAEMRFPVALAKELRSLVRGKVLNAYGPTETTVWSSICDIEDVGEFVPLGTPIANTSLHVLDAAGRECPALTTGELHIGGAGVARGYLGAAGAYRGALRPRSVRRRLFSPSLPHRRSRPPPSDGALEFLGRIDNQVKIRGHRIELGEIEAVLASQLGVEAVVHARRDDTGDQQLAGLRHARLRRCVGRSAAAKGDRAFLPAIMVPTRVVVLPGATADTQWQGRSSRPAGWRDGGGTTWWPAPKARRRP